MRLEALKCSEVPNSSDCISRQAAIDAVKSRKTAEQSSAGNFIAGLNNCETAEGRDIMRAAQVFVNTVNVDTKYDNTAFIVGLASILSGGKLNGITELKKINTTFSKRANSLGEV